MDLTQPLVSVALCTYNGEKHLKELLNSLILQTYRNIEIVVVDDCSSDTTYQILSDYKDRYTQISLYKNEINLGYSKNFEKTIRRCKGAFIALCDQDDIWDLQKINHLVDNIKSNVLIYHDSQFIDDKGRLINKKLSKLVNFYAGDKPEAFIFFNCISSHAILFKKELIDHIIPFPGSGFHDAWIGYVACNLGPITFLDKALVLYRQHVNSATDILKLKTQTRGLVKSEKYRDTVNFIKKCKELSINKNPSLIKKLYSLYKGRASKIFSFSLMLFFIVNFNRFFVIYRKSLLSKINFAYKQSRGITIKEK
jgi:glycosyltransferase involved in cell wall biosynthesis